MPLYDFTCSSCSHTTPILLKIEERNREFPCDDCGSGVLRRVEVCAPRIQVDYEGYVSPTTGAWVEGRQQHREDLAKSGCRVYEAGETQAFIKGKTSRDAALRAKIDNAVERTAHDMGLGA